jgi:transcriptional regulator with XRE-family HTH domain
MGYRRTVGQKEQATAPINLAALQLIRDGFAASEMKQEELSQASGIPRSTLANMLSVNAQSRVVHVAQMVAIAVALGIDPRDWISQLEDLERKRRAGKLPRHLTRAAPPVQRRAARSSGGK